MTRDLDRSNRLRDVALFCQVDLVEQIQIHPVQPLGNDHRIVERRLGEPPQSYVSSDWPGATDLPIRAVRGSR